MDPLQQLLDLEAIKRLKARYFRTFDTKDWDGWLGVFTDDITLEFRLHANTAGADAPETTKLVGKQALAEWVVPYTNPAQTVHHGHMPEIDILSETEAKGIWAMEDIVDHQFKITHGFGHYHETYRKVDGEWRISSVCLTRIRKSETMRDRGVL